jgi:hypothetical protein
MGSKNGKYDFDHENSLRNDNESLPTVPSELNGSILNKKTRTDEASLPKFIHQDILMDTVPLNIDNLSAVWLDTDIHRRTSNIDTEVKLKNLIHYIRVFDRVDACERYIKQIGKMNTNDNIRQEKLLVIISTTLAPTIIPHLHDLLQVKYIYVFGKSKSISKAHEQWLRKYNKVW